LFIHRHPKKKSKSNNGINIITYSDSDGENRQQEIKK